ncbi:MAG: ABC transporter substrate-binding protein [Elusimicrobia bacterium]|nr:ABC transporter substrate-binding protein [Elusimicrobiota bacterium]
MTSLLLALFVLLPARARAAEIYCPASVCERGVLPKGLRWRANDADPTWADPRAQKGGTLHVYDLSFPLTLRFVGPDSNDDFRPYVLGNHVPLTYFHPNTRRPIPGLAEKWAFGADHKTVYFKLNPKAAWSDGHPVTSSDFAYGLEFMRSKFIVDPWYNDYYTKEVSKVVIYDERTFAIVSAKKRTDRDLLYDAEIDPQPRWFYTLGPTWAQDYQWKTAPNTGPYQITTIDMGRRIVLTRKKDWWGRDLRYFKNRYNVDRIEVSVIRDQQIAWQYFMRGKLDGFPLELPSFWHDKAKGPEFDKGYIKKLWFYEDRPLPEYGMWLNMDYPLFKDKNVRLGFQYAMNIDKVLKTVLHGDVERLNSNTEGYGPATNKTIKARPFDLALAGKYLDKAGWSKFGPDGIRVKDGRRLTAVVTYGNPAHTERLVVLKQEAKKAGIDLQLQLLDDAAAFKTMLEKKHEIAYSGWAPQEEPQYWGQYAGVNAHKTQTNNFCNIDDPVLNKLIHRFRGAYTDATKDALARDIQKRIWESACYIPTWKQAYFRIAYWRWLKWPTPPGTRMSDDPISYPLAEGEAWDGLYWIDEKAKAETEAAMRSGRTFPKSTVIDKVYKE